VQVLTELAAPEVWLAWATRVVRVIVLLAGAWVLTRILRRFLSRVFEYAVRTMSKRGEETRIDLEKRAHTLVSALQKLAGTAIWMVAIVTSLTELNFQIGPLLAGLGVAGLALGLGAQSLIKDWLGGFFLLLEDQIRIGDAVVINGIGGVVEEINLRTVLVRAENGAVHVIPNGGITSLANMARDYAYYVFEATLGHGADTARALEVLREVGDELESDPQFLPVILAPLEIMGVDRLAERGVIIRARIKTLPGKQWALGRELNARVKRRLDAAGIPFPQPAP
jgi:small conductance mechanosensitive channel